MDDADAIIIQTLRKIGCEIEESVRSLSQFTSELVIEGAVKCISCIDPNAQMSYHLPPTLPARYRLALDITKACKNVGYKGDLGYETFLHGSPSEIRRVFIALLEKLPKIKEQPITEPLDSSSQFINSIYHEVWNQLNQPWVPFYCKSQEYKSIPFSSVTVNRVSDTRGNWEYQIFKSNIITNKNLIPTLLEKHASDCAAALYQYQFPVFQRRYHSDQDYGQHMLDSPFVLHRFLLSMDNSTKAVKKPLLPPKPRSLERKSEEVTISREEQLQQLRSKVETLEHELGTKSKRLQSIQEQILQFQSSIKQREDELDLNMKEVDRREKLCSLLPEAQSHIERIQDLLKSNREKKIALQQQWDGYKAPLEEEYNQLLDMQRTSGTHKLKEAIETNRLKLKEVVEEIRQKEDSITSLQSEVDGILPSALPRSYYTQRILSIVANVKKQKEEMDRVLEDVRRVQREINSVQGKVERTFTVTDEIIFRMAKCDETARRIYKLLVSLHSDCSDILQLVKESGTLSREIKDLEEQVETENRKNIGLKLKQILDDLEQMRKENQILEQQLPH